MFLNWSDLTELEKEQVVNTYLCIREEEQRSRNEITEEISGIYGPRIR